MDGDLVAKPVAGLYACLSYSESAYRFNLSVVRIQVTARIMIWWDQKLSILASLDPFRGSKSHGVARNKRSLLSCGFEYSSTHHNAKPNHGLDQLS